MIMSLSIKAFYGWYLINGEKLKFNLDEYEYNKNLSLLKIGSAYYDDYVNYFVFVDEIQKWDGEHISLSELKYISSNISYEREIIKIEKDFNIKLYGPPAWLFVPQYF